MRGRRTRKDKKNNIYEGRGKKDKYKHDVLKMNTPAWAF
jgi:hypothetical protein